MNSPLLHCDWGRFCEIGIVKITDIEQICSPKWDLSTPANNFEIWPLLRLTVNILDKAAMVFFSSSFHTIDTKLGTFEDLTKG